MKELKEILTETEGLVSYPVEPTVKIVREIGAYLGDNEAYDELFETVVGLTDVFKPLPDKRGLYRPSGVRVPTASVAMTMPKIAAMGR